MKYENAQNILPKEIIKELQKYADGIYLYIPKREDKKKPWGEDSGYKVELAKRNRDIYHKFIEGISVKELASSHYLTENSIRRIIRNYK
ncbi:MAG: CD3324 family protein [Clostridium sp.]